MSPYDAYITTDAEAERAHEAEAAADLTERCAQELVTSGQIGIEFPYAVAMAIEGTAEDNPQGVYSVLQFIRAQFPQWAKVIDARLIEAAHEHVVAEMRG